MQYLGAGQRKVLCDLAGEIGVWLALTGTTISGADIASAGLATHFCPSVQLPHFRRALRANGIKAISDFTHTGAPSFHQYRAEMDSAFKGGDVTQILQRLDQGSQWARGQKTKILAKSPLCTRIALRQIRTGELLETMSVALKVEYRLLSRLFASSSFQEGFRAMFEDEDYYPDWLACSNRKIRNDAVARYFAPMENGELALAVYSN